MNKDKKIKYLTFGSPLMDMIVDVDSNFINQNCLKLDTTVHVDSTTHSVFRNIKSNYTKYIAGGCSYNAIRVFNWMLDNEDDGVVACIGSVGNDEEGEMYRSLLKEENIESIFETFDGKITGKCAVICYDRNRCHLTDLGASTLISDEFVEKNWKLIEDVSLIYTELYILSSRASIVFKMAEHCLCDKKVFGFNLPAEFFLEKFSDIILEIISYGDVIFSNKEEARFFICEVLKQEVEDDWDLTLKLAKLSKKNTNKNRVFVVTAGPEPAYIICYDHLNDKIEYKGSFEPMPVDEKDIVDTNGAGDSFAGGFLAMYMKGEKLDICMKAGHYAASRVIQKRGCELDKTKPELKQFS